MSVSPFSTSNICLLLITIGLVIYFIYLWRVLKHRTTPAEQASFKKPVLRFVSVYTVYFGLISLLAANQFFAVVTMPPRFVLIFLPLLLIIVLLSRAGLSRSLSFLKFLPPVMLIGVQVYRLFIELVFIRFTGEKIIPVELSFHGRNYDLWIGVLALPVAILFLAGSKLAVKAGIAFNVLGLLSLVNIFSIAIPAPADAPQRDVITRNTISVYPNPVTNGFFKISFADQQPGRYNVQLLDVAGKVISTKPFNLVSKVQVEEFRLPQQLASGNYLVRVVNDNLATPIVQQLVIQQ